MDRREHLGGAAVVLAALNSNRPLRDGRQHVIGMHGGLRHIVHFQPVQPGHGKECRFGHAVIQLFQTGLQIAAKLDHFQIRPSQFHLRPTAQTGGAHDRAFGQLGDGF